MKIDDQEVREVLASAGRSLGLKELLRALSLAAGQQSVLKRVLKHMLREGVVERDGKQFRVSGGQSAAAPQSNNGQRQRNARSGPENGSTQLSRDSRAVRHAPERSGSGSSGSGNRGSGGQRVVGTLHTHSDGFGFVHPSSGDGENIFLPADEARRAID